MKNLTRCAVAAASALLLSVVFLSAQERRDPDKPKAVQPQPTQPNRTQPTQPFHGQAGQNQGDHQLAACLISDNEGEVAIAKFVHQKTQNADVKEFADQMIKDHNEFLKKLSRFAPLSTAIQESDSSTTAKEDRSATEKPTTATPRTQPVAGQDATGRVDLVRIKQEIGRQCVETAKKELGEKKGADLDKCFMGMQVGVHLHMADALKVIKNYSSQQLRSVLEEGEQTVDEHLDHARKILKDLEGKRSERTAAKEDE